MRMRVDSLRLRRAPSGLLLVLVMLSTWLLAQSALAQGKVVVREFDGPGGKRVRGAVVDLLVANGFELVPSVKADEAARAAGADLSTSEGRVAVAEELRLSAFVEGEAARAGSRTRVTMRVFRGSDGEPVGDELSVTAARNAAARTAGTRFWRAFGEEMKAATPPAEAPEPQPEPEPETEPEPEAEPEPRDPKQAEEDDDGPRPSPLDLTLGFRMGMRDFSYEDAPFGLNGYELDPSPYVTLRLRWYPVAHLSSSFLANLGLDLSGELLMFVKTTNEMGEEFSTKSSKLDAALRVRLPLAEHEVAARVGVGSRSFSVENDDALDPNFPDVEHTYLRLGAEGRIAIADPIVVNVQAAYLLGLSHGALEGPLWFPHASGNGLEIDLGVGYRLLDSLELQLWVEMERYFMTLNPEPTDPGVVEYGRVAGGATDQYLSLQLAAMWTL